MVGRQQGWLLMSCCRESKVMTAGRVFSLCGEPGRALGGQTQGKQRKRGNVSLSPWKFPSGSAPHRLEAIMPPVALRMTQSFETFIFNDRGSHMLTSK